jgi:hypothetical protein
MYFARLPDHHRFAWAMAIVVALDGLLFCTTNVSQASSIVVAAGFLLVVATLWVLLYGLALFASLYGVKQIRKARIALYGSLLFGGLIALQSVGQLSVRDLSVMVPLVIIGYAYSLYMQGSQHKIEH